MSQDGLTFTHTNGRKYLIIRTGVRIKVVQQSIAIGDTLVTTFRDGEATKSFDVVIQDFVDTHDPLLVY